MNKKRGPDNELIKSLIAAIGAVWYFLPVSMLSSVSPANQFR